MGLYAIVFLFIKPILWVMDKRIARGIIQGGMKDECSQHTERIF